MRKRAKVALLLALSLIVGIQAPYGTRNESKIVKAEEQQTESDTTLSEDGLSTYRVLDDGTISLVYYNGDAEDGKLTIPDTVDGKTVTALEGSLFDESEAGQQTSDIILPKSLKEIDVTFFRNIFYLMTITIDAENEYFATKDGILYNKDCTELIRVPEAGNVTEDSNDFVIPDTVVTIGDEAFFNCYGMYNITISKNVKTIGNIVFYRYLSSSCYFSFKVDENNPYFVADDDGSLFSKDMTVLYRYCYPKGDENSFINLVTYKIPDSVTEIASAAFQGSIGNITSFSLDGLLKVEFPKNLKKIGNNAFDNCQYLGDESMLDFASEVDSVDVIIPDSVTEIGSEAFIYCPFTTMTLPKELKEIDIATFYNCTNLSEIKIPENVETIANMAFMSCSALSKVELNEKLKTIGEYAFYNCSALKLVEVGGNVTEIGKCALGYTIGEELLDDFTILCKKDSAAAEYAKNSGTTVKYVSEEAPEPSANPSEVPSATPSATPSTTPSATPSTTPSATPSNLPSATPSNLPAANPSEVPTAVPSSTPEATPSSTPIGIVIAPSVVSTMTPADQTTVLNKLGSTKLVSAKNKKKRKIVIKIKKVNNATGYIVEYATSKKFKNAKSKFISNNSVTKMTLKKMKKKTYYIRVRSFRKKGAVTEYTAWSNAKKVKVKK